MSEIAVQVLMPVFNGEKYLAETIDSLLEQTFTEFQLIIMDDCSIDSTNEILNQYIEADPRILVIRNDENRGIIWCRNALFDVATAPFLAIADADDIYHRDRLQKQVAILTQDESIAACSGAYRLLDSGERVSPPTDASDVKAWLSLVNVFANPCAMLRSSVLKETGLRFESNFAGAADYLFWKQLSCAGKLINTESDLFSYRIHEKQESQSNFVRQQRNHIRIVDAFLRESGVQVDRCVLQALIWPESAAAKDLAKVCRAVNKVSIKLLSADKEENRKIARVWDIRLRSLCRRHGLLGFQAYIAGRGVVNFVQGKNFGMSFFLSCLKG